MKIWLARGGWGGFALLFFFFFFKPQNCRARNNCINSSFTVCNKYMLTLDTHFGIVTDLWVHRVTWFEVCCRNLHDSCRYDHLSLQVSASMGPLPDVSFSPCRKFLRSVQPCKRIAGWLWLDRTLNLQLSDYKWDQNTLQTELTVNY